MEENYEEEYLFTPKCFEKDLKKIFKYLKMNKQEKTLIKGDSSNRILEVNNRNSYAYMTSIFSKLSPSLILDKMKEYQHLKNWFPYVHSINPLLRISQYCDILEINCSLPVLSYFNIENQFRINRYWSYSPEEHSYFLMFKTFDNKKFFDNIQLAGFIITINPDSVTDSGCLLTFFIKFKKSKYSSMIDYVYKYVCREFCSSLQNFIGSVKMHKYNLINSDHNEENAKTSNENVDSYKYLIRYFSKVELDKESDEDKVNLNKKVVRKLTELDANNITQIKTFFEIKNQLANKYGETHFNDNEIIRYVVGLNGDSNKIINLLDELVRFRKTLKSEDDLFQTSNNENQFKNLISLHCQDIFKRPVILFKLCYFNSSNFNINDRTLKCILSVFNKAVDIMPSNIDKFVVVIDAKNGSLNSIISSEMAFIKKLFNIFNKFYVERLAELYIINKGLSFSSIWNNISPLIESEGVIDKVIISNNYREDLSKILTLENLNNI